MRTLQLGTNIRDGLSCLGSSSLDHGILLIYQRLAVRLVLLRVFLFMDSCGSCVFSSLGVISTKQIRQFPGNEDYVNLFALNRLFLWGSSSLYCPNYCSFRRTRPCPIFCGVRGAPGLGISVPVPADIGKSRRSGGC